jgi:hypothetical protein
MTIISNGDGDPARKLLGDLITTPVMAEEARAFAC